MALRLECDIWAAAQKGLCFMSLNCLHVVRGRRVIEVAGESGQKEENGAGYKSLLGILSEHSYPANLVHPWARQF